MKIALIFDKDKPHVTGNYFQKVFDKTSHQVKHFWTRASKAIPKDFDLYLRIDHGDYKYDIPEYLHPAAFLAIDTHLKKPYKKIERQVSHYDFVFCAQKEGAERLKRRKKVNTHWIPLACDPEIHKKINTEKKIDVAFVGSEGKKNLRSVFLEKLRERYPKSFLGMAEYTRMAEIYSSSKIGFNYSINNDINMRIFEVMSCGSMLLTNFIKDNGFKELFEDRKHLVIYKNKRELFKLIDYYLTHNEQRERIAREGFRLVREKHTYTHRLKAMFEYMGYEL